MAKAIPPSAVLPPTNDKLPPEAPTVAVVVSLNMPGMTDEVAELMTRFTRVAIQELNDCGARVVLVDSSAERLPDASVADECDGVLILGGGDVDSELYGVEGPVRREWGVDRAADDFSIDIIRSTIARDAPMLCVCRGSQLLNVSLGGDLIPDIDNFEPHRGGKGDPMFKDESINLVPGSKVHEILGRDRLTVRSGHHQAVRTVAPGLTVAALADDGIVEGTELPSARWVVGLQWHPEDDDGSPEDRRRIFSAFVNEVATAKD